MFRRRQQVDQPDEPLAADEDVRADAAAAESPAAVGARTTSRGPWDAAEAPEDELLDLGGLRVPVVEGFDISLTAQDDVPVMVTYAARDGGMQVHAFAAPRTAGIWDEVRDEIAESLRQNGGRAEESAGPFGTELSAMIPVPRPDGTNGLEPARFIGVDGPRWFLRALLHGPVARQPQRAEAFEALLRRMVVVRGNDAMAPREAIPLRLPRELAEAAEAGEQSAEESTQAEDDRPGLPRPERGPEITEVR